MSLVLRSLLEELTRLKNSGVKSVCVSDEALQSLRKAVLGNQTERAKLVSSPLSNPLPEERPQSLTSPQKQAPANTAPASQSSSFIPSQDFGLGVVPAPAKSPPPTQASLPPPSALVLPSGDKLTRWTWLKERVLNDTVCKAQLRPGKQLVFGVGSLDAQIMFVGEAPGADEEIMGEPFVGPAGQLLTKMIQAMGQKREQVYISNIMNWRPQVPVLIEGEQRGNREPSEEEMSYCLPYLRAQIDIVQPKLLVALGSTASKGLLGSASFKTLGQLRGRWHEYQNTPLLVTYHPSYLLRKESESKISEKKAKRAAWEDFLLVMELAQLPITDKQRAYFM